MDGEGLLPKRNSIFGTISRSLELALVRVINIRDLLLQMITPKFAAPNDHSVALVRERGRWRNQESLHDMISENGRT